MIDLPVEIKGLITFLVTQGLKALANLFGFDFEGWVSALVAIVAGAIIFFIEGVLGLVPVEQQPLVSAIIALVVSLLSAFGIHYTYRNVVPA